MQLFKQCCYQSEKAHFGTHWRETTQVQSMRLRFNSFRPSEEAQKDPLWSLIDAQCASFQALQLMLWKFTWWVSIQEQNNSSVTSATTLAPLLVTCRTTWRRTQGRSLSSATNAVKLTSTNKSSQNIHNSTWPQIRLEPMQRTWRFTVGRSLSQQILRTKEQSCKTFKNSHNLDSDC